MTFLNMMMDLTSSANDIGGVFGVCDCLGKTSEMNLERLRNTVSSKNFTQLRPRPDATENVSSCVSIAEGNLSARASLLKNTWHHAEILKIGESLQTRLARNGAGLLSIPCGEADKPTSVEG